MDRRDATSIATLIFAAMILLAGLRGCFGEADAHVSPPLMQPIRTEARVITATDYRVEEVLDGQTFVVTYDGERTRVVPHGLTDTSQAAAEELVRLVGGKTVRLTWDPAYKRDDQGRLRCRVQVIDLVDVTDAMRNRGQ